MYVKRIVAPKLIFFFAWKSVLVFSLLSTLVYLMHEILKWKFIAVPFLPIATIGTAVAFYIGFKNNASYERLWEARQVWGRITNVSRTFAIWVTNWVGKEDIHIEKELKEVHKDFVYRHIAWCNVVRLQLRRRTVWQESDYTNAAQKAVPQHQKSVFEEEVQEIVKNFLSNDECVSLRSHRQLANYLLQVQSQHLTAIKHKGYINDYEHSDLEKVILECFHYQGALERIKTFPFPRQYAYFGLVFVQIFIFLLPFGMIGEFAKLGLYESWLIIPFSTLISWIFYTMEVVGDTSENPFENALNDVPMTAICRNIEIDLKEILGETELPNKIEPVNGILL